MASLSAISGWRDLSKVSLHLGKPSIELIGERLPDSLNVVSQLPDDIVQIDIQQRASGSGGVRAAGMSLAIQKL